MAFTQQIFQGESTHTSWVLHDTTSGIRLLPSKNNTGQKIQRSSAIQMLTLHELAILDIRSYTGGQATYFSVMRCWTSSMNNGGDSLSQEMVGKEKMRTAFYDLIWKRNS